MKYLKVSCYKTYKTTRLKLAILLKIKIFNLLYLNKSSFKYSAQSTRLKTTKKPSEKLNLYCTLYYTLYSTLYTRYLKYYYSLCSIDSEGLLAIVFDY